MIASLCFDDSFLTSSISNFSLKIKLMNPSTSSNGISDMGYSVILNSNNLVVPVR